MYDGRRWGGQPLEPAALLSVDLGNALPGAHLANLDRRAFDVVPVHHVYLDLSRAECRTRVLSVLCERLGGLCEPRFALLVFWALDSDDEELDQAVRKLLPPLAIEAIDSVLEFPAYDRWPRFLLALAKEMLHD